MFAFFLAEKEGACKVYGEVVVLFGKTLVLEERHEPWALTEDR